MADGTNHEEHDKNSAGSVVAWLALVLAIAALALGWIAYNRTGQDLESTIRNQVDESVNSVQQGAQDVQENVNQGANEAQDEAEQQTDNAQQEVQEEGNTNQ